MSAIAVIDIGKTNAKLALVDPETLDESAVLTRPNTVRSGPPWPHFDVKGHWEFILDGLTHLARPHSIAAISVTTHGACAALLDAQGQLAAPILDYEHTGPDTCRAAYDALRPPFAQTGSPRLGAGLNLGAQLFWQFREMPDLAARVAHVVTYPQYWGYLLTGEVACDVTSLGCHTDLWDIASGQPSALVDRLGLTGKMAPLRAPADVLGHLRADLAARTGLAPDTPVACGIHDSNASLLPHLLGRAAPFGVLSTGTWVVAMAIGGAAVSLDESRDLLVNVNARGAPVPSARFMGGREHELALGGVSGAITQSALSDVLAQSVMLLPTLVPGSGPFGDHHAQWNGAEPPIGSDARAVAVGFYLALVSAECLRLIGQEGPVIVEGPFSRNPAFLDMLAAASGAEIICAKGQTGTSQGAALLFAQDARSATDARAPLNRAERERYQRYASQWMRAVQAAA